MYANSSESSAKATAHREASVLRENQNDTDTYSCASIVKSLDWSGKSELCGWRSMSSHQNGVCVGSMGLHQNNLVHREDNITHGSPSMSQSPSTAHSDSIWNINSRSVVDVFRGIRDRYFGKPVLPKPCQKTPFREESIAASDADDDDGSVASLNSLPIYCKLMVLSFLETGDVCNMSLANSHWHHVSNDQILWRELLIRDMCRWSSMTNKSHPLLPKIWNSDRVSKLGYGVDIADLIPLDDSLCSAESEMCGKASSLENRRKEGVNYKALYIHSSYQRAQDDIDESHPASGLPGLLKSIWPGNDNGQGEVIITGPGIDSPRTSKLFRSLMWGNEFLETKGLLPGNRDGIGSGVQVVFKGKTSFNLIAMYSGNNRVRENRTGMERLRNSNMVELVREPADRDDNVESEPVLTLHEAVRFYIAERKGNYKLIYTVDASVGQKWEDIVCNKLELDAILKGTVPDTNINSALVGGDAAEGENRENNTENSSESIGASNVDSKRPLLILSCVHDDAASRLSTLQIIAMLGLHNVTDRQWRVQDVVVSDMQGVEKGIDWLLRQS